MYEMACWVYDMRDGGSIILSCKEKSQSTK